VAQATRGKPNYETLSLEIALIAHSGLMCRLVQDPSTPKRVSLQATKALLSVHPRTVHSFCNYIQMQNKGSYRLLATIKAVGNRGCSKVLTWISVNPDLPSMSRICSSG